MSTGSASDEPASDKPAEELRFESPRLTVLRRHPATTFGMARRLPYLMRRALALAWKIDRRAVVSLLTCQGLSAGLEAFGLVATTSTITALVASGHIQDRLTSAAPAIAALAIAAGARALLAIAITNLSWRLSPRISREAELEMLNAAVAAELTAYDQPGFNDRWDNADRGAELAQDLITQSQQLMA